MSADLPRRHVTFAMSERKPAHASHAPGMHEDEDEDEQPLVQPASRKELAEERRDPSNDDGDLEKEKDLQYGKTQLPHWNKRCQGTRVIEQRMPRFWARRHKVKLYATLSASCLKSAT